MASVGPVPSPLRGKVFVVSKEVRVVELVQDALQHVPETLSNRVGAAAGVPGSSVRSAPRVRSRRRWTRP